MSTHLQNGWRAFQLRADDLLFFRDGKPSSLGDDHYLRSLFPPHPSTLYGAVRSRRLVDARVDLRRVGDTTWSRLGEDLRRELGEWGQFGRLELRGPWLVKDGEVLLPAPHDVMVSSERTAAPRTGTLPPGDREVTPTVREVRRLLQRPAGPPTAVAGGRSHSLQPLFLPSVPGGAHRDDFSTPERWWLRPAGVAAWRRGGLPDCGHFLHASELWHDEPRTGVGLQPSSRRSADGMIYTFGFIRLMDGVGIGFEVRHSDLAPGRRLRLGGEGRTCWLEEGPAYVPFAAELADGSAAGPLRIALATPALFDTGALPRPLKPKITSAVVAGSVPIGGWDIAAGKPKPMRLAAPAGSVYSFRAGDRSDLDTLVQLDGTNLSAYPEEALARQGFGLAVVGWGPEEGSDG